jgi:N-formylglutamate amidohydrolase
MVTGVYNLLFRVLFGYPHRDINGTPKVFTRELHQRLELRSKDWFVDAEVMLKAHDLGARFAEVEVEFHRREAGASHVRASAVVEFLRNMLRYRFQERNAWKTQRS